MSADDYWTQHALPPVVQMNTYIPPTCICTRIGRLISGNFVTVCSTHPPKNSDRVAPIYRDFTHDIIELHQDVIDIING